MVRHEQIQALADRIGLTFPEVRKVILFGSHAYGEPTSDSDVDLLVLMDHSDASYRAASRIRIAVDADFPVDFIVRSPAEIAERLRQGDNFIEQIVAKGEVLYERKKIFSKSLVGAMK